MKIQKIEIEKIRGIKKITIEPQKKSIVIFGPNGSGKSAVVDAIDFLLTGRISRLEGEGSEELSTKRHGPHVDHKSKEAIVKAEVGIPGLKETITLERRMSNPKEILFDEKYKDLILPILDLSDLGQHKLSRREILKYVIATAGTRASEIHALLDLEMIDKSRKTLVAVKNSADKEYDLFSGSIEKIKTDINILLDIKEFSEKDCLDKINENRRILKAENLDTLDPLELKKDIKQPTGKSEEDVKNLNFLKQSIKSIEGLLSKKDKILDKIYSLKEKIKEFRKNFDILKEITHRKLVELGLSLIDGRDICPLCEKPWDAEELKAFLKKRLSESVKGKGEIDIIETDARDLADCVQRYKNSFSNLESNYKSLGFTVYQNDINSIIRELTTVINKLSDPIEKHFEDDFIVVNLLDSKKCEELKEKIEYEISDLKYEVSPELNSWTILTKLEVLLGQYKESKIRFEKAENILNQAKLSLTYFETARDAVLHNIFDKINNNFVNIYKELHGEDEEDFKSSFVPDEAKLVFDVDFYGRGMFHPGAMHSEGHQDSMGVCLFLSLHKFLARNILGLIVLDDVVMSVDATHRRNFCKMIIKYFPGKQFIITTHDRVWAKQLKTEGVVTNRNMVEFKWWSIETGPATGTGENFWEGIEGDLKRNDVPQAAWKLRRNGECFLNDVCDLLRAQMVFKSDSNWELGDYLPAAVAQYNKLITKAKVAANSWGDKAKVKKLSEFDEKFNKAVVKSQYEQWAVNPSVHYNKWVDFQASDFRPVVEMFHELFGMFICEECGYIPQLLLSKDRKPESFKCSCGKFYWNLCVKEK